MESTLYLAHHGIKGQKWGVRRYQNSDGSLTDEGRRRYGYGSERNRLMTENTKQRAVSGAKIGAGIFGAAGGVSGAAGTAIALVAIGANPATALGAAAMSGVLSAASGAISGGINGGAVGLVVGAIETKRGRSYIERYDKGLADFEKRDKPRM